MTGMPVVANSSPLIYLAALSDFHFLRDLFGPIAIPPAVYAEVVEHGTGFPVKSKVQAALDDWIVIKAVQNGRRIEEVCETACLDIGEAEAIILAQECQAERLLLDDQRAVGVFDPFSPRAPAAWRSHNWGSIRALPQS